MRYFAMIPVFPFLVGFFAALFITALAFTWWPFCKGWFFWMEVVAADKRQAMNEVRVVEPCIEEMKRIHKPRYMLPKAPAAECGV